ncbi:MAG TPA: hypothetical protein VFJ16_32490 [Longimicrobium sp.]|nr:hypothetical protein [Longimicrobium sp.]
MPGLRTWMALAALCVIRISDCAAQAHSSAPVVAAALGEVITGLRKSGDGRLDGPVAFDPRIIRAPRGRAPVSWPDSVMPVWIGNVRDSAWAADMVGAVLREANAGQGVEWVTCGAAPAIRPCDSSEFPLVAAVSEPWTSGGQSQLLVYVRYRSSIDAHPYAWFANIVQLKCVGNRWVVERSYNYAGT